MTADAEVVATLVEALSGLGLGPFVVKLNHRRLLDAVFEVAGVPPASFRAACSAVDKLDKEPWSEVYRELTEDKGLPPSVADAVGALVRLRAPAGDPDALLAVLGDPAGPHAALAAHAGARAALDELATLFGYLRSMGALPRVSLDLSLARGLDYYTGVIYEAVLAGDAAAAHGVGSVAAGGRYDTLVGMFSGKPIPSVGLSVGVERVMAILEAQQAASGGGPARASATSVMVASVGPGLLPARMALAAELWAAGLGAEFLYAASPNMPRQLEHALAGGVPLLAVVGEDELAAGTVTLKRLADRHERAVPRAQLLQAVREMLDGQPLQGAGEGGAAEAAAAPSEP